MRRHLSVLLAMTAIGACTFPQAIYSSATGDDGSAPNDSSGGTDRSTSSSSGGNDGSSSSTGGGDAMGDRGSTDSASDVTTSDTSSSSGSSSGGGSCDKDNDSFTAVSCGGNDCCDTDATAHPSQTMFFSMADNCGSFDYNCDGSETLEYSGDLSCYYAGITCVEQCGVPNACTCGGSTCSYGYLGAAPSCGNSAPYGTCVMSGMACNIQTTVQSQTQACH
jgi:hypothetical protein